MQVVQTCFRRVAARSSRAVHGGIIQSSSLHQQKRGLKTFKLNTGAEIPGLGFGTFQDPDAQEAAVKLALETGVRHIDTARVYDTEKQVGNGIKASGVPRKDVFITTKLWCNSYHPDDVEAACDASLKDLDTEYLDLFLMHYPCTFARGEERFPKGADGQMIMGKTTYLDTWKALEALTKTGKVKAIGVSNFSQAEIQNLLDNGSIPPAVHQMETHLYLQQPEFTKWHRDNGIHNIQFSPLGNQNSFYREILWSKEQSHMSRLIDHPTLKQVADKYGKTPVQTALAWGLNQGRSVIPKSVIDWQIKENLESDFEIKPEDMETLATMDIKTRFNDPSVYYRWPLYKGADGAAS